MKGKSVKGKSVKGKLALLGLGIATLGVVSSLFNSTGAQGESIKIGNAYNLTGSMSSLDVPASNGAKLAAKEINAAGGVLGRQLELVEYDGKTDPATITNIASQLIDSDKVAAIGGFTDSDSALALGPIAQKAGVPFVTAGATSPLLPTQIGDYMFLAPFGDNVQAAVGAEFSLKNLKAKTSYLLIDKGSEYTVLLGKFFKDAYLKGGGKISLEDTYKSGDKSFAAQITKLKALKTKPAMLFVSALPDDIGTLVKQMRQAGINQPIVGGDGYDTPLLVQVGGAAANNVYFTTHALIDEKGGSAPVKKFIAGYKKEFGKLPDNAFAALGYDTVYLIADAIKRAGATDGKKIRDALAATKGLKTVTGTITYAPGVRVPAKGVTVIGVKNKALFLAAEMVPTYVPKP
jgi:branched-chain amino acid transport system substrate-binding protein